MKRRDFIAAATAGATINAIAHGQDTVNQTFNGLMTISPRGRVPLSFVIDDSTCLVNMGHFCTPQFATAWPKREEYKKPWKEWPREIPDSFVRKFGEWCADHGVKGKYSIVPNPACVGWLDRELPGWSRRELNESLDLVRNLMVPNWDIHPEMITHTRVINLKTGRPFEEISAATMENWYPQTDKSVDELAAYLAYALRILKNCGLPCEGITTPGGFGNAVKEKLSLAVIQSVADVFPQVDLPHYFKYVQMGSEADNMISSLEHARSDKNELGVVNVPAGTGDWFGGWQGDRESEPDRYLTADGQQGRMAELIRLGVPAVMLCHWPGMYNQGTESGFKAFQRIVLTLKEVYGDKTHWMKLSEIGRYYAASELTKFETKPNGLEIQAPFASADFTLLFKPTRPLKGAVLVADQKVELQQVANRKDLRAGKYVLLDDKQNTARCCFDLPKGKSVLTVR